MSRAVSGGVAWIALCAAACSALPEPPPQRVHRSVYEGSGSLPARAVLLPVLLEVYDVSTPSRPELVDEWTRAAAREIEAALVRWGEEADSVSFEPATGVEREDPVLEEHAALFERVAAAALSFPGPATGSGADRSVWWHKLEDFDASLGPGLAHLARSTGADAGLLVTGASRVTDETRAETRLFLGVIDFRTGDLLWLAQARETGLPLGSGAEPARSLVQKALAHYPGLEAYDEYRRIGAGE